MCRRSNEKHEPLRSNLHGLYHLHAQLRSGPSLCDLVLFARWARGLGLSGALLAAGGIEKPPDLREVDDGLGVFGPPSCGTHAPQTNVVPAGRAVGVGATRVDEL